MNFQVLEGLKELRSIMGVARTRGDLNSRKILCGKGGLVRSSGVGVAREPPVARRHSDRGGLETKKSICS